MLNLNLKLQSSVLKSQVKAIDLELRKLEAQQAAEHIAIVEVCFVVVTSCLRDEADEFSESKQPYLLPAFFDSDSDAVDALLFFQRVAYKVDLLSMFIEQNHSVSDALDGVVPENLVGICGVRRCAFPFSPSRPCCSPSSTRRLAPSSPTSQPLTSASPRT